MSNSPEQPINNRENNAEAKISAVNQLERISNKIEKSIELSPRDAEAQSEIARQEALKSAISVESGGVERKNNKDRSLNTHKGPINKKLREESYSRTMNQVQDELPPNSRAFSKIIHNKTVEKVSDITGNTLARPNSMLSGSIFAFVLTLAVYVVAKTIGYPLSGFETILAFIIGWTIGIIYDYLHILFTGNK